MAKQPLNLNFSVTHHTDPVTGRSGTFLRKGTSNQHSPRLLAYKKCMREKMTGAHGDARSMRQQFISAAKSCSGR